MTEVTALLVTVQGEVSTVDLAEEGSTLQGMYKAIGCTSVDRISLTPNVDMWLDDEGAITTDPSDPLSTLNPYAMRIVAKYYEAEIQQVNPLFGNVLITGMSNGETTAVSPETIDLVTKVVNRMK
ncbi:hypothetical protein SEA_NICEHOUSE_108 [Rhodococcus phage NiceHouse]|nr:hypothetical protein SEA_NICEHOUSE_108 [Rhodococcus phage NiceHouse]